MKPTYAITISAAIIVVAAGLCWFATPGEPNPEQMYQQYMQLSPCERVEAKPALLTRAAHAGYMPAIQQMTREANDLITDQPQRVLQTQEYTYWLKIAADKGDAESQYQLFDLQDENQPPQERLGYLVKAAEQNHGTALMDLGALYADQENEYGLQKDMEKAMAYYRRAAALNHADALQLLYLLDKRGLVSLPADMKPEDVYKRYVQASIKAGERVMKENDFSAKFTNSNFMERYYPPEKNDD